MPSPRQTEFGNEIVDAARKAVKEVGWEQAAFAAMYAHMGAASAFVRLVPAMGRPGHTIVTDAAFQEAYQEVIGSLALMTAIVAEKCGSDLRADVPATN